MGTAHDGERPVYPALAALLGNDACRVSVVLCVFHHSVGGDLRRMERAADAGRWAQVRELAHRAAWACRLIGEDHAADALDAIEHGAIEHGAVEHDAFEHREPDASAGDVFVQTFLSARQALVDVLDRAAAYADVRTPSVWSDQHIRWSQQGRLGS